MKSGLRRNIRQQKGQLVVEAVLLMVVMLSVAGFVVHWLKDSQFAEKLTVEPWARLSGMIQCGAWQACGINEKKPGIHPNSGERLLSLNPSEGGT